MKKYKKVIISTSTLLLLGTSSVYGDVDYVNTQNVERTTVSFGSSDLNMIAEKMVTSMLQAQLFDGQKKPVIDFADIKNETTEQIYTKSIVDKIKVHLLKSGKVRVSVYNEIGDVLKKELEHQSSKYVKQDTAKQIGNQVGADQILYGEITSIEKRDGEKVDLYYKITLKLADIQNAELTWADEKEIRKIGSKGVTTSNDTPNIKVEDSKEPWYARIFSRGKSTEGSKTGAIPIDVELDNAQDKIKMVKEQKDEVKQMISNVNTYREATNYFSGENGYVQNKSKALELFKKSAQMGNSAAIYAVGWMYANGDGGLVKDEFKALEYYKQSANMGNIDGIYALGWMYDNGKGGLKLDRVKAVEYYKKSADMGNAPAIYALGWMYANGEGGFAQNDIKALEYYQKASDMGNVDGVYALGWMHENGKGGLKADRVKAVEYYKKAYDRGNAPATYALGWMYANGEGGFAQNDVKAVEYYKKASDMGNSDGAYGLAWMYDNGKGVKQDKDKALELYKKAADMGSVMAKTWLKTLGVY